MGDAISTDLHGEIRYLKILNSAQHFDFKALSLFASVDSETLHWHLALP